MVNVNKTPATTNTTNNPPVAGKTTAGAKASADYETFLKLLTAQLKYQDPLNPTDGTEFTAQLAQFSSLEQQIQTNKSLESIIASNNKRSENEYLEYLNKDVLVPGDKFKLDTTGNVEFSYDVDQKLESAKASIYNAKGEVIREFNVDAKDGIHEVLWDGRDEEGNRLETGVYSMKVNGVGLTKDGKDTTNVKLSTYLYGNVTEVNKLGKTYYVETSDGRHSKISDILGVRAGNSSNNNSNKTENDHATALQMLGKEILIPGNNFNYTSGSKAEFTYSLSKDIQNVTITIKDEDGNRVLQKPFEPKKGSHVFSWDGKNADGQKVADGKYSISIVGQNFKDNDKNQELVEEKLDTFYYGIAETVESKSGIVVVHTKDGRSAYFDEIISTRK